MSRYINFFLENFAKREYSCLMLNCSGLTKEIEKLQKKIKKSDIYTEGSGHGLETCSHVTILYGLLTNSSRKVLDSIPKKPIEYKIKGLSLFENEKYDVLKFDIESDDLKKLNKKIAKEFPNENKFQYTPHLTLAYLRSGKGKKYVDIETTLVGMSFIGSVLDFSNKDGKHTLKIIDESRMFGQQGKMEYSREYIRRMSCCDCGRFRYDMFMVNDDLWKSYAGQRPRLCLECFEKRMGRKFTADDFRQYRNAPIHQSSEQIQNIINGTN